MLPQLSILHLGQKSLLRGVLLSLGGFFLGLRLAGFPDIHNLHSSSWEVLALVLALCGMGETIRCMGRHWNLYHAGVLILIYADLMILAAILALLTLS